jgi:2-keto-3-deoxy-L-rhamnonate aldolase RhmA
MQKAGFPANGCWINIFDPVIGELVGHCGYDFAMIDMEHSPASIEGALAMIRAVQSSGAKALVRVPDKHPRWPGRLMDMGADGVMVPMVNNAEEARELALACVYAPQGSRGMAASIVRATGYGNTTAHYLDNYRDTFMLLLQIETATAVDAAEEIAAIDGVDCIFIGPYDLAGSLGNTAQPDHKITRAAIRRIVRAVRSQNKLLASLTTPAVGMKKLLSEGYDLVFSGSDVGMLKALMCSDAEKGEKLIEQHSKGK